MHFQLTYKENENDWQNDWNGNQIPGAFAKVVGLEHQRSWRYHHQTVSSQ